MKLKDQNEEASFFKILLNNLVDYISLPTAFANKFLDSGNNKKQTVVLKNKSSSVVEWSVKYYKLEGRYYFMDGWLKFMKDNNLETGDFLVFLHLSHSPNLMFQVLFYAPNGCLKTPSTTPLHRRPPSPVTGSTSLVKKGSSDEDSDENMKRSLKRVFKESWNYKMPLPMSFAKSSGIIGYCGRSLRLRDNKGKTWKVKLMKYGRIVRMMLGWNDFRKQNHIKMGDTLEFNHVKDNLVDVHVFKKKGRPFNS